MPKSKKPAPKATIGTVHPPRTLFMSIHAGDATAEDGAKYTLATGLGGSPMVHSEQSKRFYTIDWKTILNLAIAAGIDNPK